jgi:hypothetical protein
MIKNLSTKITTASLKNNANSNSPKLSKKKKAMVILITVFIITSAFVFFTVKNQIEYAEWYSLKKEIMRKHTEIVNAKIRIKPGFYNLPWSDIYFYFSKDITFEKAEAIFITFLENFSDDFIDEIFKHRAPNRMSELVVNFAIGDIIIYSFSSYDSGFSTWRVGKSNDESSKIKKYYLDDYK